MWNKGNALKGGRASQKIMHYALKMFARAKIMNYELSCWSLLMAFLYSEGVMPKRWEKRV